MRINQFVAQTTGLSRRKADSLIAEGRVRINGKVASLGELVEPKDTVLLNGEKLGLIKAYKTIVFNKPRGYVVSRNGQGSRTIYDLLPPELHSLKPVGRLDKDSSGLLLLTSDGKLINALLHPRYSKEKKYKVTLNRSLDKGDRINIEHGIVLSDGISKLILSGKDTRWIVTMHEGRNRQIRRTFEALGYWVFRLHRISFGPYRLDKLPSGSWQFIKKLT